MTEELIKYFEGDELAASTFQSKYLGNDETSPADRHLVMATEFAAAERKRGNKYDVSDILQAMSNFKYIIPQGSIMSQLGNNNQIGSLSNCIVIPQPYDSYGGIFYSDQQLAQLMKRRCGVGIDISTLRPAKSTVTNSAGTSTGAISFMERFSNTTREVAQEGRRGALMLTINIHHPDIAEFIKIKRDLKKVTGANISVQITDDFMVAVKGQKPFKLRYPIIGDPEIEVELDNAADLFDMIIDSAWQSAEPGVIFSDKHAEYSPSHFYPKFANITTNPCGEIMMGFDSCRLMVLNLLSFVDNPYTSDAMFNMERFEKYVEMICYLGDDLVDMEVEKIDAILKKIDDDPEPGHIKEVERKTWEQLKENGRKGRRVGIGVTALGDMLAAQNLKYDEAYALDLIDIVFRNKLRIEFETMVKLSKERGSFKGWSAEMDAEEASYDGSFMNMLKYEFPETWEEMLQHGRRSISWSTVAPTGSVSILAQTSSGIEPVFSLYYMRRKKINPNDKDARVDFVDDMGDQWQEYPVLHPQFKKWLEVKWGVINPEEQLSKEVLEEYVQKSPWYGATAPEIDWQKRVEIQGIIQKYTTHSISSTINLPNDVSKEEIKNIYMNSWEKGLKGITVYRDGSRSGVLVTEKSKTSDGFDTHNAPKRPAELDCHIHKLTAMGKPWAILVGLMNEKPFEVFAIPDDKLQIAKKHKEGVLKKVSGKKYNLVIRNGEEVEYVDITQHMNNDQEAVTRLISLSLRHGAKPRFIVEQLDKAQGAVVALFKAISRTLKKHYVSTTEQKESFIKSCPDPEKNCQLENVEGCIICKKCGESKCG